MKSWTLKHQTDHQCSPRQQHVYAKSLPLSCWCIQVQHTCCVWAVSVCRRSFLKALSACRRDLTPPCTFQSHLWCVRFHLFICKYQHHFTSFPISPFFSCFVFGNWSHFHSVSVETTCSIDWDLSDVLWGVQIRVMHLLRPSMFSRQTLYLCPPLPVYSAANVNDHYFLHHVLVFS